MAPQVEATPRVMLRKRHCCSVSSFPPKKDSSANCQISSVDLLSPEGHKFRAVMFYGLQSRNWDVSGIFVDPFA